MSRYGGKSLEELGTIMKEKGVTLSVLAPRKIPALFALFEKAGGDLLQVGSSSLSTSVKAEKYPSPSCPSSRWEMKKMHKL